MTRTYYAPAKINLWLRVFAGDDSGYHPLDTLFCAIDLTDVLQVSPASELTLQVSGADVGPVESNLVLRAAREYYLLLGQQPRTAFRLQKRIPAGAGLGGGSSDAAAALRALQHLHDDALPPEQLLALAARIGSDVPFFLCGSPLAQATGRGERLQPLAPLPERHLLIVQPDFAIGTRDAYGWLDESALCVPAEAGWPAPHSWHDIEQRAVNTFEPVLFARYPELARVRDQLHAAGAAITLVSGSGSALFGMFRDAASAAAAQDSLSIAPGWQIHRARTLAARTD
ncbi:MAG TPA: 4-(cytidine 5'-diphospho)-2-C-methyl-D-erythritol kinase [Longimicrobiales bacterium]